MDCFGFLPRAEGAENAEIKSLSRQGQNVDKKILILSLKRGYLAKKNNVSLSISIENQVAAMGKLRLQPPFLLLFRIAPLCRKLIDIYQYC